MKEDLMKLVRLADEIVSYAYSIGRDAMTSEYYDQGLHVMPKVVHGVRILKTQGLEIEGVRPEISSSTLQYMQSGALGLQRKVMELEKLLEEIETKSK